MEWVHCNNCFTSPSSGHTFFFTSCGHLFCSKCISKKDENDLCRVCNKKCSYMEINRSLKPEMQMFFKNPRDLVQQYAQNIRTVLEFQSFHRMHLQKHQNEKASKAIKYAKQLQSEMVRRVEHEKSVSAECKRLKAEFEKQAELIQNLEKVIAEKDRELAIHQKGLMRKQKNKNFPSLNGNTPITTLSFLHCATSTPISEENNLFEELNLNANDDECNNKLKGVFATHSNEFNSPILSGGDGFLSTPAMLGISQSDGNKRRLLSARPTAANLF